MSHIETLQPVVEHGWRSGLANLLRKENNLWWGTQRWWQVGLLWLVISNSLVFVSLWITPQANQLSGKDALLLFIQLQSVAAAFGVIVLSHGLIVNEKKFGTAAWVLSNPVSRSAFIFSKLLGQGSASLMLLVGVPGLVVYLQAILKDGALFNPVTFLLGLGLFSWLLLFYFVLTLMLGALFNSIGSVIGLPIAFLLAQNLLESLLLVWAPGLARWVPSNLAKLAARFCLGQTPTLGMYSPLISTTILIVICLVVTLVKFEREEF